MVLWSAIRRRSCAGAISMRQACPEYHLNVRTTRKLVRQPEPAPFHAPVPRPKPILGPFLAILRQARDEDRHAPPEQRHTARRLYARWRDGHDYPGCSGSARDAVRAYKQSQAEVVVPLLHPPGAGQVGRGRAAAVAAGVRHQAALLVLTLPHSSARFGCLFPRECTAAFHAGHARAFALFGGATTRSSYDNSKIAVAKLIGPHERHLTRELLRLQAQLALTAHSGRLRQAHAKGHVENGVGYGRRTFLAPVPQADSWDDRNAQPAAACRREFERTGAGRDRATAELLAADQAAFLPVPAEPLAARRVEPVAINARALGRSDGNDYSVPTPCAYQALTAIGTSDRGRSHRRGPVVAEHARCWGKGQVALEPLHYLALLERQPGALDYARPLAGRSLPDACVALRRRLEQADPKGGARQYIRVLRLVATYDLAAVAAALERALALAASDAGAVRLLVERARERPAAGFDLTGRPQLLAVSVPPPDLAAYSALTSGKGVARCKRRLHLRPTAFSGGIPWRPCACRRSGPNVKRWRGDVRARTPTTSAFGCGCASRRWRIESRGPAPVGCRRRGPRSCRRGTTSPSRPSPR
jgi:transposase